MSGVSSSYKADRPTGSGNAGNLKARFEQMAKQGDEVIVVQFFYFCVLLEKRMDFKGNISDLL